MKFCPKCGTQRIANFCSQCGFNFIDLVSNIEHTQQAAGLSYGVGYDETTNCDNCGQLKKGLSACDVCEQRNFDK